MARFSLALVAGFLLLLVTSPRAEDKPGDKPADKTAGEPFAGIWKVALPNLSVTKGRPVWLVKLEKTDSGWSGEVVATADRFPKAKLKKLSVAADKMTFTLELPEQPMLCTIKLPKEAKDKLYGMVNMRKTAMPVDLEKTTLTSFDPFEEAKLELAKQPLGNPAIQMALELLRQSEAQKVKPTEVRAWAEKAVKSADLYGALYQRDILLLVAQRLAGQKGFEAAALQYAQRAERLLDLKKEDPAVQKRVLSVLATALEKSGKEADAMEVNARIKKLDFRVKPKKFAGRKGKSDRVVLVELFTGSQCRPCVAADMAFAALGKTFKPSEVVLLQYHLHVPDPDPLANPDAEGRTAFYADAVPRFGVPMIFLDGKRGPSGAGSAEGAVEQYEDFVEAIEPLLEKPSKAELKLNATRKDDKVSISAEVANLAETGDDVRLRIVLVEEQVGYKGTNGVSVHPQVVRTMPGGSAGTVMKDKSMKKSFTVDLADLRKKLTASLDKVAKADPFPDKERPMELKKLRVVAFVQNDKTNEVLQAVQADVKSPE